MLLFRGKYTIPDDSKLDELNISDGDTINILIEPDQCVNINVKCGPKTYKLETSLSMQVKELKQLLIKNNQVALLHEFFHLAMISSVNRETTLTNEYLPLHFYGVQNELLLKVIGKFIQLNIVNTRNEMNCRSFPRNTTLNDFKKTVIYFRQYYEKYYGTFTNIIMFTKKVNNVYKRLHENRNITIGDLFSENDTIYLSIDDFFRYSYPLYYDGNEIGKVGVGYEESVLSIKLRTQEQTGIPVSNIRILGRIPHKVKASTVRQEKYPDQNSGFSDNAKLYGNHNNFIEIV